MSDAGVIDLGFCDKQFLERRQILDVGQPGACDLGPGKIKFLQVPEPFEMNQIVIGDLAFARGFSDASHFSRAFRARFGVTARELRPDIHIVARAAEEASERKLRAAGAHDVISPYKTSGSAMASLALGTAHP